MVTEQPNTNQSETASVSSSSKAQVAQVCAILTQLGGIDFVLMTGANSFQVLTENGRPCIKFSFPRARRGINRCMIILEANDTYTMEFFKYRSRVETSAEHIEDVYCEDLTEIFRDVTGLETRMPRIHGGVA